MKNKRIRRSTAIHEAAHGVASCRYWDGFAFITGGNPITKPEIHLQRSLLDENKRGAETPVRKKQIALRFAVMTLAGGDAQVRQAKISRKSVMDSYLKCNLETEVQEIRKLFSDEIWDKKVIMFQARKESEKFVNDPVYWQTINALADLIQARGTIRGTDPDVKAITDTIVRLPMELEIATEWVPEPNFGEWD